MNFGRMPGMSGMGGMGGEAAGEGTVVDTAEMVYISSLALLKMLKHGVYLRFDRGCCCQ
jgi:hypothetical protein